MMIFIIVLLIFSCVFFFFWIVYYSRRFKYVFVNVIKFYISYMLLWLLPLIMVNDWQIYSMVNVDTTWLTVIQADELARFGTRLRVTLYFKGIGMPLLSFKHELRRLPTDIAYNRWAGNNGCRIIRKLWRRTDDGRTMSQLSMTKRDVLPLVSAITRLCLVGKHV